MDHIEKGPGTYRLNEFLSEKSKEQLLNYAFKIGEEKRKHDIERAYRDREKVREAS